MFLSLQTELQYHQIYVLIYTQCDHWLQSKLCLLNFCKIQFIARKEHRNYAQLLESNTEAAHHIQFLFYLFVLIFPRLTLSSLSLPSSCYPVVCNFISYRVKQNSMLQLLTCREELEKSMKEVI